MELYRTPNNINSIELTPQEIIMSREIKYAKTTDPLVCIEMYKAEVAEWHTIMLGKFGKEHFKLYTTSPMLILQELQETINAIYKNDYIEVLDGLFDTYWELIPCVTYLQELSGIFQAEENYQDNKVTLHDIKYLRDRLANTQENLLPTQQSLPNTFGLWVMKAVGIISKCIEFLMANGKLNGVPATIVASNFSKFLPADIKLKALDDILELTAAKYGVQTYQIDVQVCEGNKDYLVLKNSEGKVLKPVSVFHDPDIPKNVLSYTRVIDFVELMHAGESI